MNQEALQFFEPLDPHKADAIHRALLSGLLSNVGYRNPETHEYTGARNTKFSIFPGSSLFKKRPPWVMSAEVVETTKLYARTNAPVRPEWIERAAQHLVHRTYAEPHWQRQTAHVVAFEKVTLFGMVLVPRRLVHYGPIDPVLSRRIFIENALVDGDFRTDAEWYKHNRDLIRHVQTLQAKARRHDLLADVTAQYAFYDARVPADVYNGPLFDKWRKHVERGRPTLLFMHLRDLLKKPADDITPEKYPDSMQVGDMTLPLIYRFEPTHPADGLTVRVPLAGLNQLRAEAFEWLIPGWLEEKILALIRSLPKSLRTNFIPAPEYAANAMRTLKPGDGSLYEALALFLRKASGADVRASHFDVSSIPPHLLMRFEVVQIGGLGGSPTNSRLEPQARGRGAHVTELQVIASGRDLNDVRRELGVRAQANLSEIVDSPWYRDNVTTWDFGDIPQRVEIQRFGMTMHAYPALVDQGKASGLRLFESPEAASVAHRAGVRRLFLLQLGPDAKNLSRHVRNLEDASILYTTLGSAEELRQDVLMAAADRALHSDAGEIRTREAFVEHARTGWRTLLIAANEITQIVLDALREYAEVRKLMDLGYAPAWRDAYVDIRRQMQLLLPRAFLVKTPPGWLPHLPRLVRAIRVRIEKLRDSGLNRDLAGLVQVGPMFQQYLERRLEHEKQGIVDPELDKFRWMLEELRVSLFAQELKTSIPISVQRLDRQWALVRQ